MRLRPPDVQVVLGFLKRLFREASQPVQPSLRGQRMRYAPLIASAEPIARYDIAGRLAVLLGNVVSAGTAQYLHVLVVYERDGVPCLFVASEVNQGRETFGGGSHVLGVFPGDGHLNLGDSDEWSDRESFVERALTIARERLSAS